MIDNNILQSLGAGSGIDTSNLVKQLTEIERSAPQKRIDTRREISETQISDFGLISSALATLKDSTTKLTDPEGMFSKSASFTDSTALVPTNLSTDVQPGTYTFTVEAVAKSQSLSSGIFSSPEDAVGEGVLTFAFGNVTATGGAMTAFDQDIEVETVDITIDSSNNTLKGLRDAINKADMGVQASIVFNGSNYILQINSASGANNELQISVSDDDGNDDDTSGLSRFAFNTTASNLTHQQDGADAELTINGLSVFRESNTIDDIVEGLSLDVRQADPGTPVTITVTDDKAFAEQSVRDFVEAYNTFLKAVKPAVGIYEKEDDKGEKQKVVGSLANDSLARSMLTQIKSVIGSAIPGLSDANFKSLGAIGIRTQLDGTMSINEKAFTAAFKDNFEDVQKLFAPHLSTSDPSVTINSYNKNTKAGEYEIDITTQPSKGYYNGATLGLDVGAIFPDYDSSSSNYTFKIQVNGKVSNTITIPAATYSSIDDFVTAMQTAINADSSLKAANADVTVEYDAINNRFDINSNQFGTNSGVNITEVSDDTRDNLGIVVADGTNGTTVAGTVNGVAGFGSTNILLPGLNEPGSGMAMIIGGSATTATVNFSRGFAGELEALLDQFLARNGLIDLREDNLERSLDKIEDDEDILDRKMTTYQERLIQQFINMERILSSLNSSGSFIENLIDTLPFTASKKK